jgi:hypothetical protein
LWLQVAVQVVEMLVVEEVQVDLEQDRQHFLLLHIQLLLVLVVQIIPLAAAQVDLEEILILDQLHQN